MALVKAGWIKVFARSPVYVPADLRKLKLASSPDEQALMDAFKAMGFQVVGANLTEVPQQLNAGRLDAVYMSPIAVNATQLYRVAKNMSTIAVAPFMGGILMNKVAWQRIPEKYRGELMEASRKAADEIENSFMKSEEDSIRDMKAAGIVINEVSPQQEQEWYNDIGQYLPDLVNRNVFDKKTYEQIRAILARYRGNR
jgi:TRAP-type C4-dicarboxylate transport system substrate-binding protein